jgi:hypothetical protein
MHAAKLRLTHADVVLSLLISSDVVRLRCGRSEEEATLQGLPSLQNYSGT